SRGYSLCADYGRKSRKNRLDPSTCIWSPSTCCICSARAACSSIRGLREAAAATRGGGCGARGGQKVLLATMSSYDEWFAAEEAGLMPPHESAFTSQIEWVGSLFEMLRR